MDIREIYRRILARSESAREASGYLSWRGEWHAAAWGFSAAFLAFAIGEIMILIAAIGWIFTRAGDREIPDYVPYPRQFIDESLYVIGHAVPGAILGIGVNALIPFL